MNAPPITMVHEVWYGCWDTTGIIAAYTDYHTALLMRDHYQSLVGKHVYGDEIKHVTMLSRLLNTPRLPPLDEDDPTN